MRTFETQGMIRRRQGAGTFVVGQVSVLDSGLEMLESLETMARRLNLEVTVSDLRIERLYADQELADGLKMPLASRLISIRRVIRADGRPVAYLVDTLPEEFLNPEDLPRSFNGSVLDFLIARGIPIDNLAGSDQRHRRDGGCGPRAGNPARGCIAEVHIPALCCGWQCGGLLGQ